MRRYRGGTAVIRPYLEDVSRIPTIGAEDEMACARANRDGIAAAARLEAGGDDLDPAVREALEREARAGLEARNRIVTGHLRFVVACASRVLGAPDRPADIQDLIQVGNVCLIRCSLTFEPEKGLRFLTYAGRSVFKAMCRSVGGYREKGMEFHYGDLIAHDVESVDPDPCRLLRELHVLPRVESDLDEMEYLEEVDAFTAEAMGRLDGDRSREVIRRRFGFGGGPQETLQAIGKSLGITRERVRQIEERSMRDIRVGIRTAAIRTPPSSDRIHAR